MAPSGISFAVSHLKEIPSFAVEIWLEHFFVSNNVIE